MKLTIAILLILAIAMPADARRRRRTYYRPAVTVRHIATSDLQAWAEAEVRMMVQRRTCGHCRSAPGGTFVGVGCNGRTCMAANYGRASWRLVAEAHYGGKSCRVWRR